MINIQLSHVLKCLFKVSQETVYSSSSSDSTSNSFSLSDDIALGVPSSGIVMRTSPAAPFGKKWLTDLYLPLPLLLPCPRRNTHVHSSRPTIAKAISIIAMVIPVSIGWACINTVTVSSLQEVVVLSLHGEFVSGS